MRLQLKVLLVLLIITLGVAALSIHNRYKVNATKTESIHRWTSAQVYEIVNKVCGATGQCNRIPNVSIVESDTVNAYATSAGVVLYTGLLDKMQTADEIALVVGHEMSHILLGHTAMYDELGYADTQVTRVLEMQADKYGAFITMRAGYDICKGRKFMLTLLNLYGDVQDADHPDMAFRYNQLNVNCGEM